MPNPFSWELFVRHKEGMDQVLYPSHQPPFEDRLEHEVFDISFEHMMLRHAQYRGRRELVDVWQLHRARSGAWSVRLWRSLTREGDVESEDRTAREEAALEVEGLEDDLRAEGQPEARIAEYLEARRVIVLEWSPLPSELTEFAESGLQRCLEFFQRHPGFQPGLSLERTRAPDFAPERVFTPPRHAEDDEVARGRARLELARARRASLEAEMDTEAEAGDAEDAGPILH